MSKYLILDFKSAALFKNRKNTKDFINIDSIRYARKDKLSNFKEPITVYQISNAIHTLFGERPVPSNRKVHWSVIDEYFNIAKNSYLKIDTYSEVVNNEKKFHCEIIKTTKNISDSYSKNFKASWSRIHEVFSDNEKFIEFLNLLSNALGYDVIYKPCNTIIEEFTEFSKHNDVSYIENWCKIHKKTSLFKIFISEREGNSLNSMRTSIVIVKSGIHDVCILNGQILIPVNDMLINKLRNKSTGCCKLLDGGVVTINGIYDGDDFIVDEKFIKISEISTERLESNLKNDEN